MIIARYGAGRSLHDLARSASATGQSARRQEISLQIRKAAELLFPLAQMIRAFGLNLKVIAASNISITAKVGGGRRLWAYAATGDDMMLGGQVITPRAIWFQVTPDRIGGYARKELFGFQGALMAPPGIGYETICRAGPCICAGCWHHIATQARELELIAPHPVIERLLRTIETLRLTERDAAKASNAERVHLRQTRSAPAVMDLKSAFVAAQETVHSRSALGRFLSDTLDQWPALTLFLDNGALLPENGAVEQILERLSWRDRWIFSWHPNAHLWSATIYTILETCAANSIDGRLYLTAQLEILHGNNGQEIGQEMLPWQFGVNNKSTIMR
ncbi:MAG: transposase [Sphingomonadaceae bacterium]|nr:transposase [Sphingomonadaceae bacterium]